MPRSSDSPHPSFAGDSLPASYKQADVERLNAVWPKFYGRLRLLAHSQLASEQTGHTLSTTALVHEAYLKLSAERVIHDEPEALFFEQARRAMRRILLDYARRYRAKRRGGGRRPLSLDGLIVRDDSEVNAIWEIPATDRADVLIAVNESLERLAHLEPRLAEVVDCRFFQGLTVKETASVLGIDERTVARDWVKASAWLLNDLDLA